MRRHRLEANSDAFPTLCGPFRKGWQPRLYTQELPDFYTGEKLAVSSNSGQRVWAAFASPHPQLRTPRPLVFFIGGFGYLHRRIRSDNEVRAFARTVLPLSEFWLKGAARFYPNDFEKACRPSPSKPFGFSVGRQFGQQPPAAPLARVSPHRLPIPKLVAAAMTTATIFLYLKQCFPVNTFVSPVAQR